MVKIDNLVRSRRKTIALIVERDGSLTVRAPNRVSRKLIQEWVDGKAGWIAERRAEILARIPPVRTYRAGETLLYLGQSYPLLRPKVPGGDLSFDGQNFFLPAGCPDPKSACEAWYRQEARRVLESKVEQHAGQFGYSYKKLRITGARTRWGSCSTSGTLSFTWRLVMAPPEAIDYVVIHELAHIDHPNHSQAFWGRVSELFPAYKDMRRWFKQHGAELSL